MRTTIIAEEGSREIMKHTDVRFLRLWDVYGGMLTETQRELTNLYFNCDLSLGEIAEERGISRQSVSDCLKKCRKRLEEWEEKLGVLKTTEELTQNFAAYETRVKDWAAAQRAAHPEWEEALRELEELKK